jgi:ankyrin repeat protein
MTKRDPSFVDHESNSDFHNSIIRNQPDVFEKICSSERFVKYELNLRNQDGKTPIMLTIEYGRDEYFKKLIDEFGGQIDFTLKDILNGNSALHIACL